MFEVELDIFSGRPNPRWNLDAQEEAQLVERMLDRTVPMVPMSSSDGQLGYRGFLIRATGATADTLTQRGLPTFFRVRDGLGQRIDAGSESWLLYTGAPAGIQDQVTKVAADTLSRPAAADAKCKPYFTSSTDFSDWNNGQWVGRNNCYNYGSNFRTDTFAQPGRWAGQQYQAITVDEIHRASKADGYTDDCTGKKNNLFVGFTIWPGSDYHWYRRAKPMDGEVRWCHKPGGTPARNTDHGGDYITDPSTCDRGPYTIWGEFMYSKGKQRKTVR